MDAARDPDELAAMLDRRVDGLPLEYVVGWAEFCGLRVEVDRGVFVPRSRSEFLVERTVAHTRHGSVVVDMCCGSGALGAAVAAAVAGIELHAADIDAIAVACARRNLAGVDGHVHEGDLYDALPPVLRGHIDVLVANVPYVPTADIEMLPREARIYEPLVTLDGGEDGLDVLRRLAAPASAWLVPGGVLLVETSEGQAPTAAGILTGAGLHAEVACDSELEATVVAAAARG